MGLSLKYPSSATINQGFDTDSYDIDIKNHMVLGISKFKCYIKSESKEECGKATVVEYSKHLFSKPIVEIPKEDITNFKGHKAYSFAGGYPNNSVHYLVFNDQEDVYVINWIDSFIDKKEVTPSQIDNTNHTYGFLYVSNNILLTKYLEIYNKIVTQLIFSSIQFH